jgi:hypothetical protein
MARGLHPRPTHRRELRQNRAIKVNRPYLQSDPDRSLSRLQAAQTANIFQECARAVNRFALARLLMAQIVVVTIYTYYFEQL